MSRATEDAGLCPADVRYVNAHGTRTPDDDRSETRTIKSVFGDSAYAIPVSSTKSIAGHLSAAAGGLDGVLTVSAMRSGTLRTRVYLEDACPECDLGHVSGKARRTGVAVAASNSTGCGGSNAAIVSRGGQQSCTVYFVPSQSPSAGNAGDGFETPLGPFPSELQGDLEPRYSVGSAPLCQG
jgi:3-oxoacyl-[acyl-carrier-protein] synthase II